MTNSIVRKVIGSILILGVLIASVAGWFYIEISFDGCCGAPLNSSNDTLQSLAHGAAFIAALACIYFIGQWGWKKRVK